MNSNADVRKKCDQLNASVWGMSEPLLMCKHTVPFMEPGLRDEMAA
jgi:hypothetical protein